MDSRLANFISSEHSISIGSKFMWTDSQRLLRCIRSDASKYYTFVALRVGEILESTAQNEWRMITTKENVADEATRHTYPMEIMPTNRCFIKPEFPRRAQSKWPQILKMTQTDSFPVDREMLRKKKNLAPSSRLC
ncbi:uncharacterized protein LOC117180309 [Belonocnema kinseyi]|uniref:uncharacterized protein LOC117180309 n=1 Tax=Belonocnema kinseyi TaxID=2817044 RepID=UPI00143CEC24|nr:uncharacterized protein LOC117180309 [Belonocnema kinseyi]